MNNIINHRTLIGSVVILLVVIAAVQMKATYAVMADEVTAPPFTENDVFPGDILPAGGRTIAGPGFQVTGTTGGLVYENQLAGNQNVCATVANLGSTSAKLTVGGIGQSVIVQSGQTRGVCGRLEHTGNLDDVRVIVNAFEQNEEINVVWRVDTI